jgi:hypothetical protein
MLEPLNQNNKVVKFLEEKETVMSRIPGQLSQAVERGDVETINQFILPGQIKTQDKYELLKVAVQHGQVNVVRWWPLWLGTSLRNLDLNVLHTYLNSENEEIRTLLQTLIECAKTKNYLFYAVLVGDVALFYQMFQREKQNQAYVALAHRLTGAGRDIDDSNERLVQQICLDHYALENFELLLPPSPSVLVLKNALFRRIEQSLKENQGNTLRTVIFSQLEDFEVISYNLVFAQVQGYTALKALLSEIRLLMCLKNLQPNLPKRQAAGLILAIQYEFVGAVDNILEAPNDWAKFRIQFYGSQSRFIQTAVYAGVGRELLRDASPLEWAILCYKKPVSRERLNVLRRLLKIKFTLEERKHLLNKAVETNNLEIVDIFVNEGGMNSQSILNSALLAVSSSTQMAEILLAYGADVNCRNWDGYTPLMLALRSRNKNLAAFLLKHGANPNIHNRKKVEDDDFREYEVLCIPLADAAADNQRDLVELLLAYGANPEAKDLNGKIFLEVNPKIFGNIDTKAHLLKLRFNYAFKNALDKIKGESDCPRYSVQALAESLKESSTSFRRFLGQHQTVVSIAQEKLAECGDDPIKIAALVIVVEELFSGIKLRKIIESELSPVEDLSRRITGFFDSNAQAAAALPSRVVPPTILTGKGVNLVPQEDLVGNNDYGLG